MGIDLTTMQSTRASLPCCIRRTPVVSFDATESAARLHIKAENLQITGAYKPRATFAVLNSLGPQQRRAGVVLASSGNFAQAFAFAGRLLGVRVVVVMLDRTSAYKVEQVRRYGAEIVFCGVNPLARQPTVETLARERGMTAIDTWEDPAIVLGHASIGLEILEQLEETETVLVPVSSGGGAAGIAAAVKETRPGIRVIGVQPERANAAYVSLQRGTPTTIDYWDSMADGLSAVRLRKYPFHLIQKYLDDVVLVNEVEISEAMRTILLRAKLLAEPAGAVASAAFLSGKVDTRRRTVAVLTGGKVDVSIIRKLVS
jgi:threonine dehydratase